MALTQTGECPSPASLHSGRNVTGLCASRLRQGSSSCTNYERSGGNCEAAPQEREVGTTFRPNVNLWSKRCFVACQGHLGTSVWSLFRSAGPQGPQSWTPSPLRRASCTPGPTTLKRRWLLRLGRLLPCGPRHHWKRHLSFLLTHSEAQERLETSMIASGNKSEQRTMRTCM